MTVDYSFVYIHTLNDCDQLFNKRWKNNEKKLNSQHLLVAIVSVDVHARSRGGVTCAFLLFTLFLFFFLFSFRGGCMLCFGTVARNVRGAILLSFFLSF